MMMHAQDSSKKGWRYDIEEVDIRWSGKPMETVTRPIDLREVRAGLWLSGEQPAAGQGPDV